MTVEELIAPPKPRLCAIRKEQRVQLAPEVPDVSEERLSQLERERDNSLLAALAVQGDKHIIQVNFPDVHRKPLRDAGSRYQAGRAKANAAAADRSPSASTSQVAGLQRLKMWAAQVEAL